MTYPSRESPRSQDDRANADEKRCRDSRRRSDFRPRGLDPYGACPLDLNFGIDALARRKILDNVGVGAEEGLLRMPELTRDVRWVARLGDEQRRKAMPEATRP
jgi:hypothetical protein